MGIEEMIKMIMGYGALGVCLGYFIYKDHKTMSDFRETLQELKETVIILKESMGGNKNA